MACSTVPARAFGPAEATRSPSCSGWRDENMTGCPRLANSLPSVPPSRPAPTVAIVSVATFPACACAGARPASTASATAPPHVATTRRRVNPARAEPDMRTPPTCRCPMMAHGGASPRPPELPQLMDKSQSTNLVGLTRTDPALRQQRPVLTCASVDFYNSYPWGAAFCTLSAARLRDGSIALP